MLHYYIYILKTLIMHKMQNEVDLDSNYSVLNSYIIDGFGQKEG